MRRINVACVQTNSSDDIAENIAAISPLMEHAVAKGAQLIALPENAFAMRIEGQEALSFLPHEHEGVRWMQEFCATHNVCGVIGSIRAASAHAAKPTNQSLVIDADGKIMAHYDKIHLFDVTLPDGKRYAESALMEAGELPCVVPTALGTLGLTICYDVRFPALYRHLARAGAEIFCVPSAFTRPTGKAHWEVLLRARAIENLAYVIAPAQCGTHPGGRETYGHSMIIDPWGDVLAEATSDESQVIFATLELDKVAQLRAQFPVLEAD